MKRKVTILLSLLIMTSIGFKKEVRSYNPNELVNPGKIYVLNKYLFVNDKDRGIHIFDTGDKKQPEHISFIEIDHNCDMAIKGNYLYADSHADLLVYDISDKKNPELVTRVEKIFNHSANIFLEDDIIWHDNGWGCFNNGESYNSSDAPAATGKGGSMARFTIIDDFLYCVDARDLITFNIKEGGNPAYKVKTYVSFDIETIYPARGHLFIGSKSGMFIYSIKNPEKPEWISEFTHATACDPVVVYGDYAYVTLRSGRRCAGNVDQLDVIDISNIKEPKLKKTYSLTNPHGLDIDSQYLYICDGYDGVKIFENKDVMNISEIHKIDDIGIAYDTILTDEKILYISTDMGIFIYDVKNINAISQLSSLKKMENQQ